MGEEVEGKEGWGNVVAEGAGGGREGPNGNTGSAWPAALSYD